MQYISMHHHTHLKEQNRKLSTLAKIISKYTGPMNLYVVNFTDIQMYIYDKCPHDELNYHYEKIYDERLQSILQIKKAH